MSNIENDEHYRVKPAYNGTAGDQIFFRSSKVPFTRDCKIFQQRTRLRYGHILFKTDFTVRVGTMKTKPSFEQQPARKQEDFYRLLHRLHPVVLQLNKRKKIHNQSKHNLYSLSYASLHVSE
jgi:hypothetical protein